MVKQTFKIDLRKGYDPAKVGGFLGPMFGHVPRIGEKVESYAFCFGGGGNFYLTVRGKRFDEADSLPMVMLDRNDREILEQADYLDRVTFRFVTNLSGERNLMKHIQDEWKQLKVPRGEVPFVPVLLGSEGQAISKGAVRFVYDINFPSREEKVKLSPEMSSDLRVLDILYPLVGAPLVLLNEPKSER